MDKLRKFVRLESTLYSLGVWKIALIIKFKLRLKIAYFFDSFPILN